MVALRRHQRRDALELGDLGGHEEVPLGRAGRGRGTRGLRRFCFPSIGPTDFDCGPQAHLGRVAGGVRNVTLCVKKDRRAAGEPPCLRHGVGPLQSTAAAALTTCRVTSAGPCAAKRRYVSPASGSSQLAVEQKRASAYGEATRGNRTKLCHAAPALPP